jgi:hypothetical protein
MERAATDVIVFVTAVLAAGWTARAIHPTRPRIARRVAHSPPPDMHPRIPRPCGRLLPVTLLALVFPFALPCTARAQAVRYGVVMDLPRAALDSLWSDDPEQTERAFCVTSFSVGVYHVSRGQPVQDDTVFRVFAITDAETHDATPNSVDFECPHGMPEAHTHTPSTCSTDDLHTCVAGGLNAYSCQPSRRDLEKLTTRGDPFAVIQCDRRAFRFYYPSEYVPGTSATLAAGASSNKPDANAIPLVLRGERNGRP